MRRKSEAGQALFMAASSLVVLIGVLGLGIDMGMLRYDKRIQQTAADAAAVAGANNLAYEGTGAPMVCAGENASTANGFTDTSGGGGCANGSASACTASGATVGTVCVQVNNPPASGPHISGTANAADYVEVLVAKVQPTYFMRIFGVTSEVVTARAVATDYSGASTITPCMITVGDPAKEIGMDQYGNTTINATTCGIEDDGNFDPKGNALTINTCSFGVSGTDTGNNAGNVYCNGAGLTPGYGMPTVQDPLANQLTAPTVGTPTMWNQSNPVPGTYSGIKFTANTTLQPGVYIVTGGSPLDCGSKQTITGTGVMFYFTNSSTLNCQGGDTLNLTAMTAAQAQTAGYPKDAGILMYEDPNDTNTGIPTGGGKAPCPPPGSGTDTGPQLSGNDGSNLDGVLYFPADQLYLTGTSGTTTLGPMISDTVCTGGNSTFNLQGASALPAPLPTLANAILVE
ncbi:MAG TPA: pilus assembly protein TadG-related protein [Candidatus Acidoferrales bacterium]|nr:pilus assembly protein TadG-related protein [Candidatus Acidoferrales bacterium]